MKALVEYLQKHNIPFEEEAVKKLERYMDMILARNEHINLTAIRDREEFVLKHYIDSISLIGLPQFDEAADVIDVGTGGGFPGVPLAVLAPDKNFVLVDSLRKRLRVIDEFCAELGINNVRTVHGRAEELARNKEHREKYDLCVSRAVANLSTLCELCIPFVRTGGRFVSYKGKDAEAELKAAERAIAELGGRYEETLPAPLDKVGDEHKLIFIKKICPCRSKYPRKPGIPAKEPLK